MKGPAPVPSALKMLRGNPGQRRLPGNEPKPDVAAPEPPEFLSDDALSEWARLVPELLKLGLLARIDRDTLGAYCDALAEWKAASEAIEQDGLLTTTKLGDVKAHPAVAIRRNARDHVRHFSALFGLSPADRARVNGAVVKKAEETPIERLRAPVR